MIAGKEIEAANDRTTVMAPEIRCLEKIQEKGYTDQFQPDGPVIHCLNNDRSYGPGDVSVINFYRFEGVSDPDDMSIIYVIETGDGRKGTLIDAYGIYADKGVAEFMNHVENFNKQTDRGWS